MSTVTWRGDGVAVAQVTTIAITGVWATSDTATITINGKDVVFTVAAAVTIADIVAGVVAAFNASTIPEFTEITASGAASPITLTADTAGVPFVVTRSETTAGTGALGTVTEATASEGPNDWSTAENWSSDTVPVNSDAVVIPSGSVSIKYGLAQSAVTLASLTIDHAYTGEIGLRNINASGAYDEYRDKYLQIGATAVTIGNGTGSGSQMMKLDFGSVQSAVSIKNTSTAGVESNPPITIIGTHASNALYVTKGFVGVAYESGQVATFATVSSSYFTNKTTDIKLRLGTGCTLTNIVQDGGDLEVNSATTTIQSDGGIIRVNAGVHTSIVLNGGVAKYNSTGTITTAKISDLSSIDFSEDQQACTVTNCEMYNGSTLVDPLRTVTFTNGIDLVQTKISSVSIDLGSNFTVTPSAI